MLYSPELAVNNESEQIIPAMKFSTFLDKFRFINCITYFDSLKVKLKRPAVIPNLGTLEKLFRILVRLFSEISLTINFKQQPYKKFFTKLLKIPIN